MLAIDHKEAEESLRRKAHTLLADKDELSPALSAGDSLFQDISDACAALGIDLPCWSNPIPTPVLCVLKLQDGNTPCSFPCRVAALRGTGLKERFHNEA